MQFGHTRAVDEFHDLQLSVLELFILQDMFHGVYLTSLVVPNLIVSNCTL